MTIEITSPDPTVTHTAGAAVAVEGNWTDTRPSMMWSLHTVGVCPTGNVNPFEAGATPITPHSGGTWSGPPVPGSAVAGFHCVTVWAIHPGSLQFEIQRAEFEIVGGGTGPTGPSGPSGPTGVTGFTGPIQPRGKHKAKGQTRMASEPAGPNGQPARRKGTKEWKDTAPAAIKGAKAGGKKKAAFRSGKRDGKQGRARR